MGGRKSLPDSRAAGVDEDKSLVVDKAIVPVDIDVVVHSMADDYDATPA
jgi:hypothetical protein